MTVDEARQAATKELLRVKEGRDPAAERRAERDAPTFGWLARDFLDKYAKNKRSYKEQARIVRSTLLPEWENLKAHEITSKEVRTLLNRIKAEGNAGKGAPIMANRTKALISRLYNWGIEQEHAW